MNSDYVESHNVCELINHASLLYMFFVADLTLTIIS